MGFFSPWFLAAAAGLAVPLYLHLLKRQKNPPKPVPSLMLYESRTQSSTRHKRLHYLLLLSLRLLVLVLVDNSFSMRAGTRLADAKDAAMTVLAGKGSARAQVAAFGSQLRLMSQAIED